MALKPCKACGWQVSDDATLCPHCGAKLEPKTTKVVWFAAIAMFVVVLPTCFIDKAEEATQPVVASVKKEPKINEENAIFSDDQVLVCAASALGAEDYRFVSVFSVWANEIEARYMKEMSGKAGYEEKASKAIFDKTDVLRSIGINNKAAFARTYMKLCDKSHPIDR